MRGILAGASRGGDVKKFLIGVGALAVLIFLFEYVYAQSSRSKKSEPKAEQFISYQVLRQWSPGTSGIGMEILVSPENTKEEIMALAGHLKQTNLRYLKNNGMVYINIFDLRQAWANRDNDAYPQETYFKHFLVQINTIEDQEIRWVAKGRDEPQKKQ